MTDNLTPITPKAGRFAPDTPLTLAEVADLTGRDATTILHLPRERGRAHASAGLVGEDVRRRGHGTRGRHARHLDAVALLSPQRRRGNAQGCRHDGDHLVRRDGPMPGGTPPRTAASAG
jgi:hypothetical protein